MISTTEGKKNQQIVQSDLVSLNNNLLQLGQAAGPILMIELKIRIIAERDLKFRKLVLDKVKNSRFNEYWNCELSSLVVVLGPYFNLSEAEIDVLKKFIELRNKFVHGEYVSVLDKLGIRPEGREFLANGERSLLQEGELLEAAKALANIGIANKVSTYLEEVNVIVQKLLIKLSLP